MSRKFLWILQFSAETASAVVGKILDSFLKEVIAGN